jgi:membrane protein YdbS with pleckstrin-like domain
MAYLDELLADDEQVLYVGRQHIFVLISRIIAEVVVTAVLIAAGLLSYSAFPNPAPFFSSISGGTLMLIVCCIGVLIVLISGLIDYLRWNAEQYVITERRVLQIRGVLSKVVLDSSLGKINDVELRQSMPGRMFNFGTLTVLTAAEEADNAMEQIAAPLEFKRALLAAKQHHDQGYGYFPVAAPAFEHPRAGSDIQHTLAELAALRDRGILSVDEFEAKKRELLSRI